MTSTKDGLDSRAYDFGRIDAVKAPLWRTWVCPQHGGYNDIVAVMLPLDEPHKERIKCGCMKPYNESAIQLSSERIKP